MYTEEQICASIIRYVTNEVISHMNGIGKFVAGTALIKNTGILPSIMRQNAKTLTTIGVYNDDGTIDAEGLVNAMRQAINEYCGGSVEVDIPIAGKMRFDTNDIDVLRRYIRGEI